MPIKFGLLMESTWEKESWMMVMIKEKLQEADLVWLYSTFTEQATAKTMMAFMKRKPLATRQVARRAWNSQEEGKRNSMTPKEMN